MVVSFSLFASTAWGRTGSVKDSPAMALSKSIWLFMNAYGHNLLTFNTLKIYSCQSIHKIQGFGCCTSTTSHRCRGFNEVNSHTVHSQRLTDVRKCFTTEQWHCCPESCGYPIPAVPKATDGAVGGIPAHSSAERALRFLPTQMSYKSFYEAWDCTSCRTTES